MNKFRGGFCRAVDVVGTVDLVFIIVTCFVQVICRYFFQKSFFWVEEASIYLMIWIGFLGAAKATATQENTRLGFLLDLLPRKVSAVIQLIAHALTAAFLAFMIYYGGQLTISLIPRHSAAVKISMALVYGAVPVSGIFILIFTLLAMAETVRNAFGKDGATKGNGGAR